MARAYQIGGGVEDEDALNIEINEGRGPLSALDPTQALMMSMAQAFGRTTTPEAQRYSRDILDQLLISRQKPAGSTAIDAMKRQAEQVRAALKDARERLEAQEPYDRSEILLAIGQGLGSPTRSGAISETAGNVAGALREPVQRGRQFEQDRDKSYSELDLAEAQVEGPTTQMEFELQQLREQLENRLQTEALDQLGRDPTTFSNRMGQVIPKAIEALDAAYAPEYRDFISGGSARAAQGIGVLKFAEKILGGESDALTGPYAGAVSQLPYVGRWLQAFTSPQGADVRDLIEYVVQEQLRPILGSQFTREEGERLIARLYNPSLEEWRNARRLGSFIQQLERAYENKQSLAQYFRDKGTLFQYDGPIGYSVEDFNFGEEAPQPDAQGRVQYRDLPRQEKEVQINAWREANPGQEPPDWMFEGLARGGQVRYRRGGRVRYQEGGVAFEPPAEEDTESSGLESLSSYWDLLGAAPDTLLGMGAGLSVESLLNTIQRRIQGGTERRVVDAINRAGMDPVAVAEDIKRSRRMGVPETLLDVDAPGLSALADEAFEYGGAGAAHTLRNLRERVGESRDRVGARINVGLKPYEYFDHENKLMRRIETEGREALQEVFDQHKAIPMDVVTSAVLNTPEGKRAIKSAMKFYENVPGRAPGTTDLQGMITKPSLEFYDYIRKGFDERIAAEERSGPTEYSSVIRDLRKTFLDRLDQIAPEYQARRQEIGSDLEIRDSLRQGREFEKLQPAQLSEIAEGLTFHEMNAFRTGIAQRLYEKLDKSSAEGFNAAQQIIGSPGMVDKLRPFFSPSEFRIFEEALRREAELFRVGSETVQTGDRAMKRREKTRLSPIEYVAKTGPGLRFAVSPVGWALRLFRDRPKMTEGEANRVLSVLRRGEPHQMDDFIKRAESLRRLRDRRGARGAAAAGLGAAAGAGAYLMRDGEE